MPDTPYLIAAIALCTAITWTLRAVPFAALAPLRASSAVHYLSSHMPVGVMVILTFYTLRELALPDVAPTGLALAATLALHLWRRNAVLSVLGGTAVHVTLVSTFFA